MSNLDTEMAEAIVNLTKENASLKNELIKECKEHQEAMLFADKRITELENQLREKDARIEELEGQFAYECECNKQFVECQNELELYKRAFNVATLDLDLCKNHSQTLNDECVERFENLRNTILERIKEKMGGSNWKIWQKTKKFSVAMKHLTVSKFAVL